jgi:hypothetical protein
MVINLVNALSITVATLILKMCYVDVQDPHSSVSLVTRLRAGRPGFNSRQNVGYLLLAAVSTPALWPIQSPIQWVPGALILG